MLIGHLPAGYLLTRALCRTLGRKQLDGTPEPAWMAMGLVASVLPDVDLAYAWLVARDGVHHHLYWTHIPFFWLVALGLALVSAALGRRRALLHATLVAGANGIAHLALDSVASGIAWLYPSSSQLLVLFPVSGRGGWWVLDFVLHWTFGLELALVAAATAALHRHARHAHHVHHSKP